MSPQARLGEWPALRLARTLRFSPPKRRERLRAATRDDR